MEWIPVAEQKQARYAETHGELDERALVRRGNLAYAAGLCLLMAGSPDAPRWLRHASARWRESWDAGEGTETWGRPIGALKAALLAGDDAAAGELARWTLGLGTAAAGSPVGRYAAVLALLALRRRAEAAPVARSLRGADGFPADVADALVAIARSDGGGYAAAVASVVASFETREAYLEDVAVADTALVLAELARRNGLDRPLPASPTLP
ncbi:MAG TPA: hypothetical protein VFA82_08785 [Gaiellaceae bacterium]|nr:hypothetical protein [Gaiellaceae bacterium]